MDAIAYINKEIEPYQVKLKNHPLYEILNNEEALKVFMKNHVFAVWDFMTLLKTLDFKLNKYSFPWAPKTKCNLLKSLNEIIMSEEFDVDELGECKSHFEMYIEAMKEAGANTNPIFNLINKIEATGKITSSIDDINIPTETKLFLKFTFTNISVGKPHILATIFAFGRESIIPEMFLEILKKINSNKNSKFKKLTYYIKRHIELDGDEHGDAALEIALDLIGNDRKKLDESIKIAISTLRHRILLWDGIVRDIEKQVAINQ